MRTLKDDTSAACGRISRYAMLAQSPMTMSSELLRLHTPRLTLIAADLELAETEIKDVRRLAEDLGCATPAEWPPPLNDGDSQRWFVEMLVNNNEAVGWGLWYVTLGRAMRQSELIGNAGFKGRPVEGSCEIGYSLLPQYQNFGYATEAAQALISWAFGHDYVLRVVAETLPALSASQRVMTKCGMKLAGEGNPENGEPTLRFEVLRPDFEKSPRQPSS